MGQSSVQCHLGYSLSPTNTINFRTSSPLPIETLNIFFFLLGLGFELRTSYLQSRCFTAWAMPFNLPASTSWVAGIIDVKQHAWRMFLILLRIYLKLGTGAHACNPSYSGGRDQEDRGSKPAQAKCSRDPISKKPITKGWWSGSRWRPWVQTPVPKKYIYIYLEENLLGHIVNLVSVWGTAKPFSKTIAPFHIPINSIWGFQVPNPFQHWRCLSSQLAQ
jgi:hypothetical protein